MKKLLMIFLMGIMCVTLICCKVNNTNYASSTVVGKITEINDTQVSLLLGELNENNNMPRENGNGNPPEKPNGEEGNMGTQFVEGSIKIKIDLDGININNNNEIIEISALKIGDILKVSFYEKGNVSKVYLVNNTMSQGQTFGDSAYTLTEDGTYEDQTYTSTKDDENALRIDNAVIVLKNIKVNKDGGNSSNTENGDFYGVNAAILAINGSNVTIENSNITSNAKNGNGVFCYGEDTIITINDCTIITESDNSGGIQTTGGGTTYVNNLTIKTSGSSSAAIRSDRGGGTVDVVRDSYTTSGYNSPAIYSTAKIIVKKATLISENSEALVIEGDNSITLEGCVISGNMSDTKGSSSDINVHNIMLYQSMSGDASIGTSSLNIKDGKIVNNNGDMIFVTNTNAEIVLENVQIENNEKEGLLLNVSGNDGSHGGGNVEKNGANVKFNIYNQVLEGDIEVDSISTLQFTLDEESVYTGTINIIQNNDGENVSNNITVTVKENCVWNLTGNCTLSSLENYGIINFNGYTITLSDGTVLK